MTGLGSPHFAGRVYCTALTKHLVSNTVEAANRVRRAEMAPDERMPASWYKFANLRKGTGKHGSTSALKRFVSPGSQRR